MSPQTTAFHLTATPSGVSINTSWNTDALIKAGLILVTAGFLLQAFRAPR
jgi:hypothetical protein